MASVGFDGNAPVFREARGSEITDPKTGKIVRQAIDGPQNVNIDRLEWLLAHRGIEKHQHEAGRRLQADWEQSQLMGYAVMGGTHGGAGERPSDAKLDAMGRYARAIAMLIAPRHRRVIDLVVLENISVARTAIMLRVIPGACAAILQDALDVLAAHYGLTSITEDVCNSRSGSHRAR